MESGTQDGDSSQPGASRRISAVLTLLLLVLLGVFAIFLALLNLPSLLGALAGVVVVVIGLSFGLRSSGPMRVFWIVITGVAVVVVVGSLLWLALSSPWGLLAAAVTALAIGSFGSHALRGHAPTVGRLSASRPVLLVNPKSGGGKATDADIALIAAGRGIQVRILERGDDLAQLARDAIAEGADAIGMAGGDGSLGYVAAATIDAEIPFVCIPAGTRNHFARDLGLDRTDIVGALDAFHGEIRMIDYATVNGRVYLNVASLGVYAETVSDPEYRDAKINTARKTVRAVVAAGDRFDLRFSDQSGRHRGSADLIMVSSGRYEIRGAPADMGKRVRLDSGQLGILTLTAPDPAAALEASTLRVPGALDRNVGWNQWEELAFDVDSGDSVPMGIDGETLSMDPPLRFEIHSAAFAVAVPQGTPYGPRVSPISTIRSSVPRLWEIATGR